MKNYVRFVLAVLVLVAIAVRCAGAQQGTTVSLVVERGDTLRNLFGSDWQKAYQQNRITVMRHGNPIESPDILVEGMVLQVSADTLLTERAATRIDGLNQKRADLEHRLDILAANAGAKPTVAPAIALCRSKLNAQQFYAADITFVSNQVSELESSFREDASASDTSMPWIKAIGLAIALLGGLTVLAWLVPNKKQGTGGLARYERAEAQLNRLLERNAPSRESAS